MRGLDHARPTGVFFSEQSAHAISAAVEAFEQASARILPQACRENADRFAPGRFRAEFKARCPGFPGRKLEAIRYMGSTCDSGGREGPPSLFEFHHWNAAENDFGLSEHGIPRSWEKTKAELAKCTMLCANCHREVHAGVRRVEPKLPLAS